MKMPCPMCKSKTKFHSCAQVGRFVWEYIYCCSNPYCGCTFVVSGTILRVLRPPKAPNPDVNLPVSTRAAKRRENKAKREAAASSLSIAQTAE